MFVKVFVFLFSTALVFCESSYLDSLKPCKIDDGKCQGAFLQSVIKDTAKPGIPEINLPSIDPMNLKDFKVNVLDVVELVLPEGQLKGIRHCHVDKFGTNIDERHTSLEMTCNLTLKTKYKVFSNSSFIQGLTGGNSIHGEGNGKVKIENFKIKFDFFFVVQKKNGEIYILYKDDKTAYTYEFAGKVTFSADQLYIGNEESSKLLIALINENSKTMVTNYSKYFMDQAIKIVYKFIHKFFDNVPCHRYISDDLSAYVE